MPIPSVVSQTLLYAISVGLMRGISLFMLPFIAHYLTPEDFGRLEVLSSLAIIGSILAGLGLEDTLYRFVGQCKTEAEKKKTASSIFSLTIVLAFIFLFLGFLADSFLSDIMPGDIPLYAVQCVLIVLALEGVIAIPLGWLRIYNRAKTFCLVAVGRVVLQACLVFLFLEQGKGITGIFEAGLIAACLQASCLAYLQWKDTKFHIDTIQLKQTFTYSLPIVGSGFLAFGLSGLDRWVIAEFINLDHAALYGIAAKFSLAVTLLLQPFGMWWMPRRFVELNRPNGHIHVLRYSIMGLVITASTLLMVSFSGPIIIAVLLPENYHTAGMYLIGLLAIVGLKEACEFVNIGCFTSKTTKVQLWINILATTIGCSLMLLSVIPYGLWGVVFALVIAQSVRCFLFFHCSQKVVFLNYPKRDLLFLLLTTLGILGVSFQLSTFAPTIINNLEHSVIFLCCFISFGTILFFIAHRLFLGKKSGNNLANEYRLSISNSSC